MGDGCDWRLQSDWYSPTRLHDSPVEYDFPGDRFIPNRSLMDLDQAQGVLTNRINRGPQKTKLTIEYQRNLGNLTLDAEGRPFQMLVFRGSPKSGRKIGRLTDEMRRSHEEILTRKPLRRFPKSESCILDAPNIRNDYYLNIMEWGKTNVLAVALGTRLYLWNAENHKIELLSEATENDYPASVSWSEDAKMLAVGYRCSRIQLFDAESLKPVRCLNGHQKRVGSISWKGNILTSGSCDRAIINHDVRARNSMVCYIKVHKGEVCGLKWSNTGSILASGANDNLVCLWDACKMSSMHHLYRLNDHRAAVKALAWCPYNYNMLATGGGSTDGSLKIWNTQKGVCINSIETKSQICGLQWNRHHNEILSGHGYGFECQNQLCLWRYPSMSRIGGSVNHRSRVLHLSQSPDGLTVVSAGEDETLRFWEVFGPASDGNSRISYLESLLSLKTSPIR
ncbi:cell division cycle 20.2, cofactor of APC complex-like [Sesamum indicum]|uniref:Cell division cycle 20.2, cofactor of APC complex-like n=1 Tax=Sesamum indicum TaxID=4182 RepID=A0A6I9T166_SESIN|nr:cell division cycle 20.2, cofactor of APC complex-like [Sesamum indicum]